MSAAVELGESESRHPCWSMRCSHRKTAAIKAAIELDLFHEDSAAEGRTATMRSRLELGCAERGVRILCDFLVVSGFLTKNGENYALTPSSQVFLDRRSPAYMGAAIDFPASPRNGVAVPGRPGCLCPQRRLRRPGECRARQSRVGQVCRAMGAFTGGKRQRLGIGGRGMAKAAKQGAGYCRRSGRLRDRNRQGGAIGGIVALDWKPVLAVTEQNADECGRGCPLQLRSRQRLRRRLG